MSPQIQAFFEGYGTTWAELQALQPRFALPAGGYATSLLGEVFALETPPNE